MESSFLNKRIFGIKVSEHLAVILFYLFCAISYQITIWISAHGPEQDPEWNNLFDLGSFWRTSGLDYLLKLLITIPFWWVVFRGLRHWKLNQRVLLHLIGLPLFVMIFKFTYYEISDQLGWWRLGGFGQVWDVYIPALFYCLQFGVFHVYEYYHTSKRDLILKNQLREAALSSELSALKAQLNPHFLYNVFNTISASVPPEQEKTREMIANLSDLFRYQLKASKSDLVRMEEELEFVENYLDLEKARFEDRLQVEISVSEAAKQEWVPPMILQPLIENSIKHGIAPLIDGGKIELSIFKQNNQLHFRIADTGVGIKDKSKLINTGVGLTNTKLRLEKKYGSEMKFSDNIPSGLVIEFSIQVQGSHVENKTKEVPYAFM